LQAVVAAGYLWLAIVAVIFSLIGCFYYLRVVKIMYFDQPTNTAPIEAPDGHEDSDVGERPGRGVAGDLPAGADVTMRFLALAVALIGLAT
jgi:formate hydrogenlyase subunit 3/multisubunit Na+/H+ antiporter MnhD subunit